MYNIFSDFIRNISKGVDFSNFNRETIAQPMYGVLQPDYKTIGINVFAILAFL